MPPSLLPLDFSEVMDTFLRHYVIEDKEEEKMEKEKLNILIFGCGGVGTWVANFLTRINMKEDFINTMEFIDYDTIEQKNLQRQDFTTEQVSQEKAYSTLERADEIDPDLAMDHVKLKITDEESLKEFPKESFAIATTDNVSSKRAIMKYFDDFILANCDNGKIEIKQTIDDEELKAWDLGGGYTNEQTIFENIIAAIAIAEKTLYYYKTGTKQTNQSLQRGVNTLIPFRRVRNVTSNNEKN